ncbi:helix-turn-helix transcriptional regulator [Paraburkholderia ferrariae]|jgi:prophage regulatory protein|uniref:helix-turn-helix transcriptional regulator n=1 Tax=Paraburkholderia ferrariae TaxID=386056 RepID=UPI0004894FFB|nr:AlpA family phage regulatory protein [Paraburkholderia ferrariae]
MEQNFRNPLALLRCGQVMSETGLARPTIYARMSRGTFPKPVRSGENSVGWRAGDIDAFLKDPAGYRAEGC